MERNLKSKVHNLQGSIYFITLLLFITLLFSLLAFIYSLTIYNNVNSYVVGSIDSESIANTACDDFDPCTRDIKLDDGTCTNLRYQTGHDCSEGDVCYKSSSTRKCCGSGNCVGNRASCKGICPNLGIQIGNASNCSYDLFPLNYQQFDNFTLSCIYGVCTLTTIEFTIEQTALDDSYLFNISRCYQNMNYKLSRCIQRQCRLYDGNLWTCIFKFKCSSFDYGDNLIDNTLSKHESYHMVKKSKVSYPFPSFDEFRPHRARNEMNIKHDKMINELLYKK